MWTIKDWANNECFNSEEFNTFDNAEDFLLMELGQDYEDDRQEYYISEAS